MKEAMDTACAREQETLAAARSGRWEADLREHARLCPDCAAALAVDEALQSHASALRAEAVPGSAETLLWRASLRARIERAERAARPVAWFDRIAIAVAAALALLGLLWRGEAVFGWVGHALGGKVAASPQLAVLLIVLFAFTGAVLWIFGSWAEE